MSPPEKLIPEYLYRCKKSYNPHESAEATKLLPWAMSIYVLNKYFERSPLFHLTAEDVCMELDNYRIKPHNDYET